MLSFSLVFLATALAVSLKCWQQLNVINRKIKVIPLVSMAMAFSEVLVISRVVVDGFSVVLPMGLGGGFGCLVAIKLFDHAHKNKN